MFSEPFPAVGAAKSGGAAISAQSHLTISLTKHYKGITLNLPVRILQAGPDSAVIRASQHRALASLNGVVHLHCEEFSGAIAGHIHPVDVAQGAFLLSDLAHVGWRDRREERVQPKTPTYVTFTIKRQAYRAYVEDISLHGMGLLVKNDVDTGANLRTGAKIHLELHLTAELRLTHLKGVLVYRQEVGRQLVKLGLRLFASESQKTSLQRYIVQRHDEIIAELEQESMRMREPRRSEDLYF
jgi:hypothetical protein